MRMHIFIKSSFS